MSEPFMPVAEWSDESLIDIGGEVITWAEWKRRDRDASEAENAKRLSAEGVAARAEGIVEPSVHDPDAKG